MVADARAGADISVRAATPDDVDALVALINDAYRKSEGHVFPTTTRTERGDLARRIGNVLLAQRAGDVVGCVDFEIDGERAHFGMLAAAVALHGEGIGSLLIEHVEAAARSAGCTVMHIEVVKEGSGDRVGYYERRGYRVTGETPGDAWNDGADWGAVLPWTMVEMEKPL